MLHRFLNPFKYFDSVVKARVLCELSLCFSLDSRPMGMNGGIKFIMHDGHHVHMSADHYSFKIAGLAQFGSSNLLLPFFYIFLL